MIDRNTNVQITDEALAFAKPMLAPVRVLNLYCGIGGNRKLWENVEVTAVEYNEEIAMIYKDHFPNDNVIVADAHQYLLDHFKKFDFIWSSPPCPSHSRMRYMCTKSNIGNGADRDIIYPDMKLYQEILLLQNYAECNWVIENVIPYYEPLIPAQKVGRHLFWSNFKIGNYQKKGANVRIGSMEQLQKDNGFDISKYKIKHRKDTILRNCVDSELGQYILDCANKIVRQKNTNQTSLFTEW
jgi:DNA (cytosine-5)-methyltransferase 1